MYSLEAKIDVMHAYLHDSNQFNKLISRKKVIQALKLQSNNVALGTKDRSSIDEHLDYVKHQEIRQSPLAAR